MTNTPSLASGAGTRGHYYVVGVAGATNLDGIIDWQIGDWAIFNGTAWEKVDNTDTGAALVAAHEAAADPHVAADYQSGAEVDADVAAHNASGAAHGGVEAAFGVHAVDLGNPHGVTAAQAGADPTGTASAAVAAHEGAADPHTGYQRESEKGAANGYAGLGADSLVPAAQSRVQSVNGQTGAVVVAGGSLVVPNLSLSLGSEYEMFRGVLRKAQRITFSHFAANYDAKAVAPAPWTWGGSGGGAADMSSVTANPSSDGSLKGTRGNDNDNIRQWYATKDAPHLYVELLGAPAPLELVWRSKLVNRGAETNQSLFSVGFYNAVGSLEGAVVELVRNGTAYQVRKTKPGSTNTPVALTSGDLSTGVWQRLLIGADASFSAYYDTTDSAVPPEERGGSWTEIGSQEALIATTNARQKIRLFMVWSWFGNADPDFDGILLDFRSRRSLEGPFTKHYFDLGYSTGTGSAVQLVQDAATQPTQAEIRAALARATNTQVGDAATVEYLALWSDVAARTAAQAVTAGSAWAAAGSLAWATEGAGGKYSLWVRITSGTASQPGSVMLPVMSN